MVIAAESSLKGKDIYVFHTFPEQMVIGGHVAYRNLWGILREQVFIPVVSFSRSWSRVQSPVYIQRRHAGVELYFEVIESCLPAVLSGSVVFSDCSASDNESLSFLTLRKYISVQTIKQNQTWPFLSCQPFHFPLNLAQQKPSWSSQCGTFWQVKKKEQKKKQPFNLLLHASIRVIIVY